MSENVIWQPEGVSYAQRCRQLGQRGCVIWLTGLSGSGKSTLAVEVQRQLRDRGRLAYLLDGDNLRHGLNADLGFSDADRRENIRRVTQVAALMADAGLIALVSCITPFAAMREQARAALGDRYFEVYVKADFATCAQRDPKGLYRKQLSQFTGKGSPYQVPERPDLVLDTQSRSREDCAQTLLEAVWAFSDWKE